MKTTTARRLLRLNREFYDAFAAEFADSRSALQPGIVRALQSLGELHSLLDVGCGDGRVGRALASGVVTHRVDRYLGVDFSERLLEQAASLPDRFKVVARDLAAPEWMGQGDTFSEPFDAAVCFSLLHHIPGPRRRLRLLRDIRTLLQPGARCAVSVWQFLHAPRLRRKIVSWAEAGLRSQDIDPGDYLLDWRRGGRGLRYVHHFDEAELVRLCRRAGFDVLETFRSDGRTPDGELGLYTLLKAVIY